MKKVKIKIDGKIIEGDWNEKAYESRDDTGLINENKHRVEIRYMSYHISEEQLKEMQNMKIEEDIKIKKIDSYPLGSRRERSFESQYGIIGMDD